MEGYPESKASDGGIDSLVQHPEDLCICIVLHIRG